MSLVIFVEEPSMEAMLRGLMPSIGLDLSRVTIIAHQGVSDLESSLPRKLRSWKDQNAYFLIMRDNDRGNCEARKAKLLAIAEAAGKAERTVVRIVCQELEAWFLGDPVALEKANYISVGRRPNVLRCDPDNVQHPADAIKRLIANYQKFQGAQTISSFLNPDDNRSKSFLHCVATLRHFHAKICGNSNTK